MSSGHVETRAVRTLALGGRLSIVVGLLILVVAGYLLVTPVEIPTDSGVPFRCGTAGAPTGGDLALSVCSGLVRERQLQAGMLGLMALIVVAGGMWAFGTSRRVDRRIVRADDLFEGAGDGPAAR